MGNPSSPEGARGLYFLGGLTPAAIACGRWVHQSTLTDVVIEPQCRQKELHSQSLLEGFTF